LPFDEKQTTDKTTVAQNDERLAKRKRALLESNPPGITSRKLIETMRPGAAPAPFPDQSAHIGSIDFPTPE
jgi:hypothetical protein